MTTVKYITLISGLLLALLMTSCEEKEYRIPEAPFGLQNDCIKHSLGPNVAGTYMEFAYAMAIRPEEGKIVSAEVEASIPGDTGTYLSHLSLHTDGAGNDVGVAMGEPSVTTNGKSKVEFTTDTSAATLRYYYQVPEEAMGQIVTFTFSAKANNGETVTYDMGPYEMSKMDMKLDLKAKNNEACYISIEDMRVYDAQEAAAQPDKIDLIYLYRSMENVTFEHALVSPSADVKYLPDVDLPGGMNNQSRLIKAWDVRDQQLARLQYGVFIDDVDLLDKDFENAPDFAITMREEAGLWVQTADGRYNAYIFINSVDNANQELTFSIKRLERN